MVIVGAINRIGAVTISPVILSQINAMQAYARARRSIAPPRRLLTIHEDNFLVLVPMRSPQDGCPTFFLYLITEDHCASMITDAPMPMSLFFSIGANFFPSTVDRMVNAVMTVTPQFFGEALPTVCYLMDHRCRYSAFCTLFVLVTGPAYLHKY